MEQIEKLINFWCKNNNIFPMEYNRNYGGNQPQSLGWVQLVMPYSVQVGPLERGIKYTLTLDVALVPQQDTELERAKALDLSLELTLSLLYFLQKLPETYYQSKLFYSEWPTIFPNATLQQPGINIKTIPGQIIGHEWAAASRACLHTMEIEVWLPHCYESNMFNNLVNPTYPLK